MKPLPFLVLVLLAGCIQEEPVHRSPPVSQPRTPEERRSHDLSPPGPVGSVPGARFFVELQSVRPEAAEKRAVLVEEDERRRMVGHAYLPGRPRKGFVDLDVVVVATEDTVSCYDCARHELRWETPFPDREIDELVRRGSRLEVFFAGKSSTALSLATGQRAP